MNRPNAARPLIAFAYLAEKFQQGGDIVSGLIPLLKPITSKLQGKRFEAAALSELIAEYYDLDIHPYALEGIAPRMAEEKLIECINHSASVIEYRYLADGDSFYDVDDDLVETVTSQFLSFAKERTSRLHIDIDDQVLIKGLDKRIKKSEFFGILVKHGSGDDDLNVPKAATKQDAEHQGHEQLEMRIDVLVASFLLNAREVNSVLFDQLIKLTSGALIAEVINDFRSPTGIKNLEGIQIFLDAPFLMRLFDLGSKLSTIYATKLFEQLLKAGAEVVVFRHSLDEFVDNLQAVMQAKERREAYGETAGRLTDPAFRLYAKTLPSVLEDRVLSKNIKIIPYPSANYYRFFTVEEEAALSERLDFHHSTIARERDARSIASVMRMRSGQSAGFNSIQKCVCLFLTSNATFARLAETYLTKSGRLQRNEVPPCISDRYFAGLLWVMFGGGKGGLPEHRLLANCARAVQVKDEVIAKMHNILSNTSREQAEHFTALMTSERGSQFFMELTLSDSLLVSDETARDLFVQLETIAGAKVAKEKDEEIEKLKEDHDVKLNQAQLQSKHERERLLEEIQLREKQREELKEQLLTADAESLKKNEDARIVAKKLQETERLVELEKQSKESLLAVEKQTNESHKRKIVNAALKKGRMQKSRIKGLIMALSLFVFVSLNVADKYLIPQLGVNSLAADISMVAYLLIWVVLFLATFWFIPERVFGGYADMKQKKVTYIYLEEFGQREWINEYEIDWDKGCVI